MRVLEEADDEVVCGLAFPTVPPAASVVESRPACPLLPLGVLASSSIGTGGSMLKFKFCSDEVTSGSAPSSGETEDLGNVDGCEEDDEEPIGYGGNSGNCWASVCNSVAFHTLRGVDLSLALALLNAFCAGPNGEPGTGPSPGNPSVESKEYCVQRLKLM